MSIWHSDVIRSERQHPNPLIGLIDSVSRLQGRLNSAFAGARGAAHLPATEMTVLNAVVEAARPPTVPQIGRSLGHPRQVIQRAANQLLDKGLIATSTNPDHKRAALLVPTPEGLVLKDAADTLGNAVADRLLATVDPDLASQAIVLLDKIRAQLEAHERSHNVPQPHRPPGDSNVL